MVEYSFWEEAIQGTNCRLVMDILTIYMYPTHASLTQLSALASQHMVT